MYSKPKFDLHPPNMEVAYPVTLRHGIPRSADEMRDSLR